MKLRIIVLIVITAILSACNLTLAEDVTPPPGYIPPTPIPTLVLVPPQIPNVANGESIYFEKCAACHGDTGLGDGPQGIQLGVSVPALALSEIARPASPAGWYTTVTRGKIERFMPPFVSLNDQERWDVVAYIMTLHTSKEEIQRGRKLFENNCPDCSTDFYKDLGKMSGLSTVEVARIVRLGNDEIQAFGENLSDEDMWAVAEYLRSLMYEGTQVVQTEPTPATRVIEQVDDASVADVTVKGSGIVRGYIVNKAGKSLPSDQIVTLRGFEHNFQDPNSGTVEVFTAESPIAEDGTFVFENVEVSDGRIFLAEITYEGVEYRSDFMVVEAGQTSVTLPPLTMHKVTQDISGLVVDELDIFLAAGAERTYEILALYTFRNAGDSVVYVEMKDSQEIPFLKFPVGAQGLGYEALQDSAPFTSTANGFAMSPSEQPYGIIALSSVTQEEELTISQPLVLPVSNVRIFIPEGMEAQGNRITQDRPQDVQGNIYQSYFANDLLAGEILTFTISGAPNAPSTSTSATAPSSTLLIGAGGLGIALILAGAWMYLRDKTQPGDDEDDESEFDSTDDVIDAIIALDDLHRAKKISDDAYQKRRAELKEVLKEMV